MTTTQLSAPAEQDVRVPARTNRPAFTFPGLEVAAVVAAAIAVWSASRVDVVDLGDLGVAPALPAAYWAALVGLNVAFVTALVRGATSLRTMCVLFAALIVTLFGIASIASPFPRLEPTWRHLGIIQYLSNGGPIDRKIDAYFTWPGFFSFGAAFRGIAGLDSLMTVSRWAPVWINAMWLVAASVPLKVLARSRRRFWMSMWVFCLGNWIDQDYFSPQAFAFFAYLVVIGLTLWGLRADVPRRLWERRPWAEVNVPGATLWWNSRRPAGAATSHQRVGLVLLIVMVGTATIVSHQLTPIFLVLSLGAITLTGRSWAPRLPLILGMLLLAWLMTGASTYLVGHPVLSLDSFEEAAGSNVADRLGGSAGHVLVVRNRMLLFAGLCVLAAVGFARRWRASRSGERRDPVLVVLGVLAVAPFLLIPANAYGGEMLMRATLFALPFLAVLVSDAFTRDGEAGVGERRRVASLSTFRAVLLALVFTGWAAGSVLARYGNARFDMFTRYEVEAIEQLYRLAPDDGVLVSAAHPTPWRHEHYAEFRYTTFQEVCRTAETPDACTAAVLGRIGAARSGGMIVIMRGGENSLRMQGIMTPEELATVERAFLSAPHVSLVYENRDARLYAVEQS